jgi:HK97 family phage prohead protease
MSETISAPEQRTIDVDVASLDTRGKTVHGYAAVYDVLSEDLGGYREKVAAGAFSGVLDADVRALLNHDPNEVLGRTRSGTLRLFDEPKGLRFELDLPDSPLGENMRSAISRGDIDGASFRFDVGTEAWDGDIRTVKTVKALHDVTLATFPAYPAASVELRTKPTVKEAPKMDEQTVSSEGGAEAAIDEKPEAEQRTESTGTFRVTERDQGGPEVRTLFDKFKAAGWAPKVGTATIPWREYESASENRALAWSGSVDNVSQLLRVAPQLGYDQRFSWPAFQRVGVDAGVTSVSVLNQTARTLIAGGTAVRAIDAVSTKPAIGGTVTMTAASMKQIAAISSGLPNVYLENGDIENIVSQDLRLAYADGLDFHTNAQIVASSGTQTLASDPLLNVIRRSISLLWSLGYNADTLLLTPTNSETLDLLTSGGTAGWPGPYVFGAGQFGPPAIFGLQVRVSKNLANPVVVDSNAYGRLYAGPVSLQRFEENAGASNSSLVRFEGNALFNVERSTAAVRIT